MHYNNITLNMNGIQFLDAQVSIEHKLVCMSGLQIIHGVKQCTYELLHTF